MKKISIKTIIHGHFYQPPREDPWTDQIEEQSSAYPYKNWNIRITKECYGPNSCSRILDHKGKIKDIVNNYKYISFNFGPTLLNWLEKEENDIYKSIIEADKSSIEEHNGHGNAIAQVYNHVIMPLQNYEDKKTQIIWGLKDFERRFGRKSEGLWLSETACDYKTVDMLIDFDIKYIILSPDQAKSYKKPNSDEWIDVTKKPINTRRAYKIIREHGEIAVFYYDKQISTAISFEHLLQDGNKLADMIISGKKDNDLVVIATDGEVYGHHEPFGDMCLAYLIKEYYVNKKEIKLMNFGEYLEEFPAQYETSLSLGDDNLGSSWSCFHGVGRWHKDCGCHTGGEPGWNQQWRKPLREAFDLIKNEIDVIYKNNLEKYTDNIWGLRNDYIDHILDKYDPDKIDFLTKHLKRKINTGDISKILTLLESQKYSLFMYTSCAWFFTELTGIETIQNIKYAYKAIHDLLKYNINLKSIFENKLENAKSNIKIFKDGKWILKNWVYPYIQDLPHIVNNYVAIMKTYNPDNLNKYNIFNSFGYKNFYIKKIKENYYEGIIDVYDKRGYKYNNYIFLYHELLTEDHKIYIIQKDKKDSFIKVKKALLKENYNEDLFKNNNITILTKQDLVKEIKESIIEFVYADKKHEIISCGIKLFNDLKPLLNYYKKMKINLSEIYKSFLKLASESFFHHIYKTLDDFPSKMLLIELIEIFNFINYFDINVNTVQLKNKISSILYDNIQKAHGEIKSDFYKKALILIEFCNKVKLVLDKSTSENLIFSLLKNNAKLILDEINNADNKKNEDDLIIDFRNLIIIADNFNINTEKEKRDFFEKRNLRINSSFK